MKLLDKQRLVAKYDVDNFITKHIVLYAKQYLGGDLAHVILRFPAMDEQAVS